MVQDFVNNLHWLGHDGFRLDAEKTIYIDPYQIATDIPADIILITHDHFDHCSPDDIRKIRRPDTVIVTTAAAAQALEGDVRVVRPGDTLDVGGITTAAVAAYNTDKNFHPRSSEMLGFVVTAGGIRIYHAGDTDLIPEMSEIEADIALLPVSGTYVMTADEAAKAALIISPALAIPMHYASIVGSEEDALHFLKKLAGRVDVKILERE